MKNIENLPEELFDLLSEKSFEELTKEELDLVTEHMDAASYKEYQELLSDFQALDDSVIVEPSNKRFTRSSESAFQKLISYKIPFYQAASVLLLLGFFAYGYLGTDRLDRAGGEQLTTVPQVITDKQVVRKIKDKVLNHGLEDSAKVVQVHMDSVGKSLSEERYPRELIFNL